DDDALLLRDLALLRPELARERAEERRLPRPVHADEPHALAALERARDVLEDGRVPEVDGDALGGEERHAGVARPLGPSFAVAVVCASARGSAFPAASMATGLSRPASNGDSKKGAT